MIFPGSPMLMKASVEELRSLAASTTDRTTLHWLSFQDDPEILENVAKNINVDESTIDNILSRLDEVAKKVEQEKLVIPQNDVYPEYSVDFMISEVEKFKTRICFACGWNPQISSKTLDALMKSDFQILLRGMEYHRLNNLFLKNPKISEESIQWLMEQPTYFSADTVEFLRDPKILHDLAKQIIQLIETKPTWFTQKTIHRIMLEFGRNPATMSKTITILVYFIKYGNHPPITCERRKEELLTFANHENISLATLDDLLLERDDTIRQAVIANPNATEALLGKYENIKRWEMLRG